jgi:hypothetical protein
MPEPKGGDMFPDDPTATEVSQRLEQARLEAERRMERVRRAKWDEEHGPLTPEDRDQSSHGLGEIEAGDDNADWEEG